MGKDLQIEVNNGLGYIGAAMALAKVVLPVCKHRAKPTMGKFAKELFDGGLEESGDHLAIFKECVKFARINHSKYRTAFANNCRPAHGAGLAAGPARMVCGIEMPLGVRHQSQYPAGSVADARHVGHRAVGVIGKWQVGSG